MVQDTRTITALHWQPRLGADGEIVEGLDDIAQAIAVILTTRKGQDPLRPEFGSNLPDAIDLPVSQTRPFAVRETVAAIERWEPRARVESVAVEPGNARLSVRVTWRPADGVGDPQTTEVRL